MTTFLAKSSLSSMSLVFFGSLFHPPMKNAGVVACSEFAKIVDPVQFSERSLFPSMFCKSSIHSLPHYRNRFLFAPRRQFVLTELGMMTLSVHPVIL